MNPWCSRFGPQSIHRIVDRKNFLLLTAEAADRDGAPAAYPAWRASFGQTLSRVRRWAGASRSRGNTGPLDIRCDNTYHSFMDSGLKAEIRQAKPFASGEQEAFLNLLRTAAALAPVRDRSPCAPCG